MKTIFKIARTELKMMFYSPVAWLIIVIFCFQSAMVFTSVMDGMVKRGFLGWKSDLITSAIFTGSLGLYTIVQQYLFLYIPLLTMGILSREYSSGSIKLLYSSPLTNRQIVLGKYLSLVIYLMGLMVILSLFGAYGATFIRSADIPMILTGLLGLFLLSCAYAAIGLFMSSLTSYTVVSAMGTLGIFALLKYIKSVGQDVELVRDITYWLAISGRSDTFVGGLITSEDFLYFIVVIVMFLAFTIIKMQGERKKQNWYVSMVKYLAVFGVAAVVGFFSSKPSLKKYYDSTHTKINTLTKGSQEVLKYLDEDVTITTYTNMLDENYYLALPQMYKYDVDRFKQYLRFKPQIQTKYVYYYHPTDNKYLQKQLPDLTGEEMIDTLKKLFDWKFPIVSYNDIKDEVDLSGEKFHFVRSLKTAGGKQTFLRAYNDMLKLPNETEITAAFKRLVIEKLPTVGFVYGHGERKSDADEDRGYNMLTREKSFRYSLINQGFDFEDISLDEEVPRHIRFLIIADPRKNLSPEELKRFRNYIDRGGNCIIAGEPGSGQYLNPLTEPLGVSFLPGTLVKPDNRFQSDLLLLSPTYQAENTAFYFTDIRQQGQVLPVSTAAAVDFTTDKGFDVLTLLNSDSTGGWLEKETINFIDDTVILNANAGEIERSYPIALALSRKVNGKDQKIIVTGDADFLSNGELMINRPDINSANFNFIRGIFFWLTDEELPVDMRRPLGPDDSFRLTKSGWHASSFLFKWCLPIVLMLTAIYLLIRRKRR